MKIKTLSVSPTAFLHLKGPDEEFLYEGDQPVGIDMFGPGSREFAKVEERASTRALRRMQENDGKVSLPPIEERRKQEAEDLSDLTAGFRNIEVDGLAGAELYKAVYSDPELGWIKEQAAKFSGKWGNFKQGSNAS